MQKKTDGKQQSCRRSFSELTGKRVVNIVNNSDDYILLCIVNNSDDYIFVCIIIIVNNSDDYIFVCIW